MARGLILAVDQGTTNTKVILLDDTGTVVARASRPVRVSFPVPGWVEQDAAHLWETVTAAIDESVAAAGGGTPDAVAITNQRESVLLWDRATGTPLGPCIVWQCRRTAAFCDDLRRRDLQSWLEQKTGLTIDPLFSASKIRWLIDTVPNGMRRAAAGELCAGTIDSWLLWNVTGGAVHACDVTNASRTQLLDLSTGRWDDELLSVFGIPRAVLPEVRPSSGVFGRTVRTGRLGAGVPVASLIGDSHAALFGHGAFTPGPVKATYGTGSSLMTRTDGMPASAHGLSRTVAWAFPDGIRYALEGNITVTGGVVDWFGQFLGGSHTAETVAAMAETVADTGGVYLVPAFAGLGAPYWDDRARGLLCGLTRGTTAAHVARAAIESMAFQVRDVFEAMRAVTPQSTPALLADGGASRNDALMQCQADLIGCEVIRNTSQDLSACGTAWLAGLAVGTWASLDVLRALPRQVDRFQPRIDDDERARRSAGWREAVARARGNVGRPEAVS